MIRFPPSRVFTHADGVVQSDGADARKERTVALCDGGCRGGGHEEQDGAQAGVKHHDGESPFNVDVEPRQPSLQK